VPLRLIAGPANAGKVELLLDRYLAALDSRAGAEPVLIVPNVADVNRVELELLARRPALLGGSIGTFDDLFRRLAAGSTAARRQLGRVEQALLVRRVVSSAQLHGYTRSAAHAGFAESLERTLEEHPAVAEAAVIGLPDERKGEIPVAVVRVGDGGSDVTEKQLVEWAREHMADYKSPRQIKIVDELPRTGTDKVQKDELLKLFEEDSEDGEKE